MTKASALFAALAVAFAATGAQAATNLVTNGSFESTLQASGTWNIYRHIDGWTTGLKGVEVRDNVAGRAFDGSNFVELDTTANSLIAQTIATNYGEHYTLSFAYSARPGTAGMRSNTNDILVKWGATPVTLLSATNSTSNNQWTTYSFDVVGSKGHSTTLSFWATGKSDSYGGSLDNVSLISNVTAPVPEPETYALMLAGLAAVTTIARRRSRQA
ncbi:DUF642 domain-containing protein [Aquincola tertiaricarbonis]|uniref:DUF642 domain-containing protein n=1 Tax=Aquincola tertiaricarbonis TaxID=391953 RepID=A0ABY4S3Q7_AQUTE|nr:DUF642 domain-containing protein [Aquincola tertiaricarbonis]URI06348.1 DUF642 domain-containing protein [Aquincola tertiaricarbonis]